MEREHEPRVDTDAEADEDVRVRDCVVVGAGPAGLMAAIYLKRFLRDVVLVDGGASRTRYIRATRNCPGFPGGISGDDLLERLRAQFDALQIDRLPARVSRLLHRDGHFALEHDEGNLAARTVIAATGVVDRLPRWDGVEAAIEAGVLRLCAVCDAYEVEDLRLAVFGPGGDALRHACFLRTYSPRVTAVVDASAPASDARDRTAAEALGIQVLVLPQSACHVDGRAFVVATSGGEQRFDVVYIAMGAVAQTQWLEGAGVLMESSGDVHVDAHGETTVAGVYAIGDVVHALNQISVAFGHAAIAATAVHNRLPRNPA